MIYEDSSSSSRKSVVIVIAEVWNGDFTRRHIFGVYKDKKSAEVSTAKSDLPAFGKFIYETWYIEGD